MQRTINLISDEGQFIPESRNATASNIGNGDLINPVNYDGYHLINVGMTLISVGACNSFFRTVRWLLLHRKIGPVLICIIRVIKDVVYVFIIFIITFIAFSVGLW